ncbi:helix-turn-helix transcriptional regulator [Paenibacillus sp. GSMTC-2017]|uniref:winged helix-turn-helix transcriptional regulator n=1 Tax=Paenibacillus sp. GSMTC-2017 TaxID=2794350 RepID=UPI0018D5AFE2|nr:helix-turn-helix domain-containing protein [Paenibacillus sp. GSMTC-2017]MBH5318809.1 helix-turn-helix transcriptional regulator [Paenibacillus sp. GSMTC-2017]
MKGKWKIMIVWYLRDNQRRRYNEFLRLMPRISKKVMTQQLQEMEYHGIIKREVFDENPPRVEYYLAPLGQKFIPILWQLYEWGELLQEHSAQQESLLPPASSGYEA